MLCAFPRYTGSTPDVVPTCEVTQHTEKILTVRNQRHIIYWQDVLFIYSIIYFSIFFFEFSFNVPFSSLLVRSNYSLKGKLGRRNMVLVHEEWDKVPEVKILRIFSRWRSWQQCFRPPRVTIFRKERKIIMKIQRASPLVIAEGASRTIGTFSPRSFPPMYLGREIMPRRTSRLCCF